MKSINSKVKYVVDGDSAKLYAKYKNKPGPNPWVHFANCHLATIALLKKDGVKAHSNLLTITK